jgi:hypothetical protein
MSVKSLTKQAIVEHVVRSFNDWQASQGVVLSADDRARFACLAAPVIRRACEVAPEAELGELVLAALFDALGRVCEPEESPEALAVELAQLGAYTASLAIQAGKYPEFPPNIRAELISGLRRAAEKMIAEKVAPPEARRRIGELAPQFVRALLGDPPVPARRGGQWLQ